MEERRLRVSCKKTEYMQFNEVEGGDIKMQGYVLKRVNSFKYLGLTINGDREKNPKRMETLENSLRSSLRQPKIIFKEQGKGTQSGSETSLDL